MTIDSPWPAPDPATPAPPRPPSLMPRVVEPRGPHATLPIAAGLGALLVLTLSLIVSKVVLDLLIGQDWPTAVYIVIVGVFGYGPSIAWWVYASRRWGSGRLLDDVGLRPRLADVGWAPVVWVAALLVQGAIAALILGLEVPFSNNTDALGEVDADRSYVIAIVVAAVVAAPIVEEVVFRGLLMRSLLSKVPALPTVVLQGLLFGVAHVDPVRGAGNIGLALVLSGVGIVFGGAAYLIRRIGPTVLGHAILNGVVMTIVLSGLADDLRNDSPIQLEGSGLGVEQIAVVDQPDVAEPHGGRDPHAVG